MKAVKCENCDGYVVFDEDTKAFVCNKCGVVR